MYLLKIGTIPLPKLYVCDSSEAKECRKHGVPYIIKPDNWDDEKLIKAVLWRTLHKKFPKINWRKLFGKEFIEERCMLEIHTPVMREVEAEHRDNPGFDTCGFSDEAMEFTENGEYRSSGGGMDEDDKLDFEDIEFESVTIDDYIGDLGYYVNIEQLQALKLLPVFLDDIANAIKLNICNTAYMDGYNKKLECNLGSWQGADNAPNLIILDTSGSIPSGVAGTMVSLIETLRSQANADLIITSGRSEYWAAQEKLPSPDQLRRLIGGCNECRQFYAILREHILGKHWGNVIIFGDQDAPEDPRFKKDKDCWLNMTELQSTRIDNILAFHTYYNKIPGYGLWAEMAAPKANVTINTDWVDIMKY